MQHFEENEAAIRSILPEDFTLVNMPLEEPAQEGNRVAALVDNYGDLIEARSGIDGALVRPVNGRAEAYPLRRGVGPA